jgi:hypothetical protein
MLCWSHSYSIHRAFVEQSWSIHRAIMVRVRRTRGLSMCSFSSSSCALLVASKGMSQAPSPGPPCVVFHVCFCGILVVLLCFIVIPLCFRIIEQQRAEIREQRAESREQRAESREHRAESREHSPLLLPSPIVALPLDNRARRNYPRSLLA